MIGAGSGAVQRELAGLTGARIVNRVVEGRQVYYQVNTECPVFRELRDLIRKTFGIGGVVTAAIEPLSESIRIAFIYGSVAAGKEGPESDIDLMLIGDRLVLDDVVASTYGAQQELGREINPSVFGTEEFHIKLMSGHHFLSSVIASPKIFLIGSNDELERLAQQRVGDSAPDKRAGNHSTPRARRPRP
jgi:predicted nucleotidyltransferase